jgi:pre-rRNA-processing protein TSR1
MEIEPISTTLHVRSATDADSLVSTNHPDDMANEQTWPGEDEMREGHDATRSVPNDLPDAPLGTTPKIIKRVPKGTSAYQAAWMVDDEDDEENSADGSEVDEDVMSADIEGQAGGESEIVLGEDEEEMEDLDLTTNTPGDKDVTFEDLDAQEEDKQSVDFAFIQSILLIAYFNSG